MLAAIVGAGIGSFVVLADPPAPPEAAAWSSWEPNGSKLARVRQIADRIPKAYTQPNGEQLTVSQASPLAVPTESGDVPVSSIFVRPDTSRGQAEEERHRRVHRCGRRLVRPLRPRHRRAVLDHEGKPTSERFTLLRRQALELSLYTFKYVDDVDSVIVFMPPTPKGESNGTVFLRRDDVADELRRPSHTPAAVSATRASGAISEVELGNILRLTQPRTYAFQFQAASDGRPILMLTPPAAGS